MASQILSQGLGRPIQVYLFKAAQTEKSKYVTLKTALRYFAGKHI